MTTPDIFLSYNREDQAVTKLFADVRSPQRSGLICASQRNLSVDCRLIQHDAWKWTAANDDFPVV